MVRPFIAFRPPVGSEAFPSLPLKCYSPIIYGYQVFHCSAGFRSYITDHSLTMSMLPDNKKEVILLVIILKKIMLLVVLYSDVSS